MDNKTVDHKIKDFFEPRTINPSTQSWDRLDVMLSIAETQKKKKSPIYLMVAASLAPILMISIWFIFKNDMLKIKTNESLVSSQSHNIETKTNPESDLIPDFMPEVKVENTSITENIDNLSFIDTPPAIKNKHNLPKSEKNLVLTSHTSQDKLSSDNPTESQSISINDDHETGNVIEPTIGQGETTQNPPKNIESEIVTNISQKKDAGSRYKYGLDPEKLLQEAENKSQQSFLSKVFKTLTEKSESVVIAVSTRNEIKAR